MRERRRAGPWPYRRFEWEPLMVQGPVFQATPEWQNFHQSYTQFQQGTWDLYFPKLGGAVTVIEDLKETTRQFQDLIGKAQAAQIPIRANGSRWSLSRS